MNKILALTLVVLLTNLVFAQKAEKLDSLFKELSSNKEFQGNALIAEKGKVIYSKSFGFRNESLQERLDENSIFELASISKQFTAFGIVLLKEKKKLKYDDKIATFLPELSFYGSITVRDLLTHTSGLPDYMHLLDSLFFTMGSENKIAVNTNVIEIFALHKPKLKFEPNTQFEYSNTGYVILASIIEKVSGQTFSNFLESEIFSPLKMTNTSVYRRRFDPRRIENYAFGYVFSEKTNQNTLPDDNEDYTYVRKLDGIVGDGTVNSTVKDLYLWHQALNKSKLISDESMQEIFTAGKLNDNTLIEYSFGWRLEDNGLFGKMAFHGGSWPGYKTYIERHLDNNILIVFLQNYDNENIWFPIKQTREIMYDMKPITYITNTMENLKTFTGNFAYQNGTVHEVFLKDNKLLVLLYGDEMELKPILQNKFHLIGFSPDVFFEFIIENNEVILRQTQPELRIDIKAIKKK
jgi:CubicO group peptidase (beta-lactamase class C family)